MSRVEENAIHKGNTGRWVKREVIESRLKNWQGVSDEEEEA